MNIFDQIAAGARPAPRPAPAGAEPSLAELQLGYALAKQVPAMECGFTIYTSYGAIDVVAGPLADRLQAMVRAAIEHELAQRAAL